MSSWGYVKTSLQCIKSSWKHGKLICNRSSKIVNISDLKVLEELAEDGVAYHKAKLKGEMDASKLELGNLKVANKEDSVTDDNTSIFDAGKGKVDSDNNTDCEIEFQIETRGKEH